MVVFERILSMRAKTVVSVTEKNIFFEKNTKSAATNSIRSLHRHSTHHIPSISLCYTSYQQQSTKRTSRLVRSTFPKRELPTKTASARRIRPLYTTNHPHGPFFTQKCQNFSASPTVSVFWSIASISCPCLSKIVGGCDSLSFRSICRSADDYHTLSSPVCKVQHRTASF